MSTNKGIARFDPRTNMFRNFGAGDGLQSDEFNRHAYCKDSKGRLYFGGVSGFNYFDPHRTGAGQHTGGRAHHRHPLDQQAHVQFGAPGSPLQLPVQLSTGMEIPYEANMVTFSFATMEFAAPELHEYRYMLEGFDADGSTPAQAPTAPCTPTSIPAPTPSACAAATAMAIWDEKGTSFILTVRSAVVAHLVVLHALRHRGDRRHVALHPQPAYADRGARTHRGRPHARTEHEKDRSEELLKNILPENVANELKVRGTAQARHFDQATVLFSDFKEFTRMSRAAERRRTGRGAQRLLQRLRPHHGEVRRGEDQDHRRCLHGRWRCARAQRRNTPRMWCSRAWRCSRSSAERQASNARPKGKATFEMRVGIHTGPVVAGIVGRRKFQYDIWGDTVNIASRMETTGEPGEVNISSATYALVKDAPELRFTPRGMVSAKGKGEMEMYYVRARSIQAIVRPSP
jgi:class 3 adenylate cyclase